MDIPFIGRKKELESCIRILKSEEEHSRIIMLEGAPGTGKTSFLHKLIDAANDEGYLVCSGIYSEEHDTLSLQIWMNILEKCRLGMLKYKPESGCRNENEDNLFSALYGAWDGIEQFREIGAENKKHLLFSWIASYLACCSKKQKLCITIDNLHLSGRSSLALFLYLYTILDDCPVSFILCCRPVNSSSPRELIQLSSELQYKRLNLKVKLDDFSKTVIEKEYTSLAAFNPDLPAASEIYRITLGNPLGISVLLRTGNIENSENEPLNYLWNRYKESLDEESVTFIEYLSLLGNYISRTETAETAELLGIQNVSDLLDTCISASILKPQGAGISFYHEELRKIIYRRLSERERAARLNEIIDLYGNDGEPVDETGLVRLAGLFVQLSPSRLKTENINCLSGAADIMMKWNAWDKAVEYLECALRAVQALGTETYRNGIETRLAFCYLENMDNETFNRLFPALADRLIKNDDRENLMELLKLNSYIWNFYPETFLAVIEHLLIAETDDRISLTVLRAVVRSNNPFTVADSLDEIGSLEDKISDSGNREDLYRYFTCTGYLMSMLKQFERASDMLFKAEALQIGRFRFLHLVTLAKIKLFTFCTKDKELVLNKIEYALKITRNELINISYQGMLQRRSLYDGKLDKVLSFGKDPSCDSFDYLSIPRFMAYLWMGEEVKTESIVADFAAFLEERAGENEINGPLIGILWLLSAHYLITGCRCYTGLMKSRIAPLLKIKSLHEGFRIHLLITAGRIASIEYSPDECRYFYDELSRTSDFFLEEEIHSVEIAKGLLAEGFGDYTAAEACFEAALNWCVSVEEKPWRSWLLSGQLEYAKADRAEAATIASEFGFNRILKMIGRKHSSCSSYSLTIRESEVLGLVSKGFTDREIGGYLKISEHTVANHLRSIYKKLDVSNRVEASRIALIENIISG